VVEAEPLERPAATRTTVPGVARASAAVIVRAAVDGTWITRRLSAQDPAVGPGKPRISNGTNVAGRTGPGGVEDAAIDKAPKWPALLAEAAAFVATA